MENRQIISYRVSSIAFVILAICFALSCTDESSTNPVIIPELDYSTEDSLEAIHMASFWDEQLLPTESTTESLLFHLNYLRYRWSSFDWLSDHRFLPPWEIGVVIVGLDSIGAQEFRDGNYTGFDTLEDRLVPDSIVVFESVDIVTLNYDEPYNPLRLGEIIETLPGVEYAVPSVPMFLDGVCPSIQGEEDFPLQFGFVAEEWAFVFHRDWDLPHYYFNYASGEPDYLGVVYDYSDSTLVAEVLEIQQQWHTKSGG